MRTNKQNIPTFKTEAQERAFWESHDSTTHVDWTKSQQVKLPDLRPTASSKPTSKKTVWTFLN